MFGVAALLTCFNRKAKTLACLQRLYGQQGLGQEYSLEIYLVDDGCTDGTAEAVARDFPAVHIIRGNGALYWNQGMRLAWQAALDSGTPYDFFLWVNDDSMLYADALPRILGDFRYLQTQGQKPGAIVGSMVDPQTGVVTYGGRLPASRIFRHQFGPLVVPAGQPQPCRCINGNFTLVPAEAVRAIGILSPIFTHSMGDHDYGFRLVDAGFSCWVASGASGECARNPVRGSYLDKTLSLQKRLQLMKRPSQLYPMNEWLHYVRCYSGPLWPLVSLKIWLIWKFPVVWILLKSR